MGTEDASLSRRAVQLILKGQVMNGSGVREKRQSRAKFKMSLSVSAVVAGRDQVGFNGKRQAN